MKFTFDESGIITEPWTPPEHPGFRVVHHTIHPTRLMCDRCGTLVRFEDEHIHRCGAAQANAGGA